jgi:DNA sulfur modification protein DndD
MQLQSIKLENFRQFKDEEVEFSVDKIKNVTIILGENGTGKTSISQAFTWCLYGTTEFKDQNILNKIVAKSLEPGKKVSASVVLKFIHGDKPYIVKREQVFEKENNRIVSKKLIFNVGYKQKDGVLHYLSSDEVDIEISKILPPMLSKYFFFDGERIDKMSKDLQDKDRSAEFANAVHSLLGLNAMQSALIHLRKPHSKYSVIGHYEDIFNAVNDAKIKECTDAIKEYENKLEQNQSTIDTHKSNIINGINRISQLQGEIAKYADAAKLQSQVLDYKKQLGVITKARINTVTNTIKNFWSGMNFFFGKSMINKSITILAKGDYTLKGIPTIDDKTLDFLLEKGKCICGCELREGTQAYKEIKALYDYIPPKVLGSAIGQFVTESRTKTEEDKDAYTNFCENMGTIRSQDFDIAELQKKISNLETQLGDPSQYPNISDRQNEIKSTDTNIKEWRKEIERLKEEQGALRNKRDIAEEQRKRLALADENNKKIEIYKSYAEKIYEILKDEYTQKETIVRQDLEKTINEIFNVIYNGDMSITIDEKYNIQANVNSYSGYVETSSAQSISVIYAFIAGVIKMAREGRSGQQDDNMLLTAESYPLVMDAPLSTFDKRRIKSVCETLPQIAKQVIIFIKDTDGDFAKAYLANKIGRSYVMSKVNKNEFLTHIVREA